jgi:hypothetical protein
MQEAVAYQNAQLRWAAQIMGWSLTHARHVLEQSEGEAWDGINEEYDRQVKAYHKAKGVQLCQASGCDQEANGGTFRGKKLCSECYEGWCDGEQAMRDDPQR